MQIGDKPTPPSAWVIGASSGIGRALSLALVKDGWRVAVSARGAEGLESLFEEARTCIEPFPVDITDKKALDTVTCSVNEVMGPLSLVVLCAGNYERDNPSHFDSAALQRMVDLNLMGTANCLERVLPPMIAKGKGQVAVVSSVSGYAGLPGAAFYGATKAGLAIMCEAMYPQLKSKGIDIKLICPGFVETPLTSKNDFPMPFIVSAEKAAGIILRGLKSKRFEIAFPWQMKYGLKLLRFLPYPIQFALTKKMLRKET